MRWGAWEAYKKFSTHLYNPIYDTGSCIRIISIHESKTYDLTMRRSNSKHPNVRSIVFFLSIFISFESILKTFLAIITQKDVVLGADGRLQGARRNFLRIANTYKLLLWAYIWSYLSHKVNHLMLRLVDKKLKPKTSDNLFFQFSEHFATFWRILSIHWPKKEVV